MEGTELCSIVLEEHVQFLNHVLKTFFFIFFILTVGSNLSACT